MGTASRKTWLEKQDDKVQVEVLAMDDAGLTLEAIGAALKEKFGVSVPHSTLGNALKIYHDTQDLRWAAEWGTDLEKLIAENPQIQASKLAKGFLTQKMASASFRGEPMDAADVVAYAQNERRLDLQERQVKAVERRNELQKDKNDLERRNQELREAKFKRELEEATHEVEDQIAKGQPVTAADIQRLRERVIGGPVVRQSAVGSQRSAD